MTPLFSIYMDEKFVNISDFLSKFLFNITKEKETSGTTGVGVIYD